MQGCSSVILGDCSPSPQSLQVTLERSLVSFQKSKEGCISPKAFTTISPTPRSLLSGVLNSMVSVTLSNECAPERSAPRH